MRPVEVDVKKQYEPPRVSCTLASGAIGLERVRESQRLASIERIKAPLTGYLATLAARTRTDELPVAIDYASRLVEAYLFESGIDFAERVEIKRRRLGA